MSRVTTIQRVRELMQDGRRRTVRQMREDLRGVDGGTVACAAYRLWCRDGVLARSLTSAPDGRGAYLYWLAPPVAEEEIVPATAPTAIEAVRRLMGDHVPRTAMEVAKACRSFPQGEVVSSVARMHDGGELWRQAGQPHLYWLPEDGSAETHERIAFLEEEVDALRAEAARHDARASFIEALLRRYAGESVRTRLYALGAKLNDMAEVPLDAVIALARMEEALEEAP